MRDIEDDDDYRQALYEELADRSPVQWWEEDHLQGNPEAPVLRRALDLLVRGGCLQGELLERLREIEELTGGYNLVKRRELKTIIERTRRLAADYERIEMTALAYSLPTAERVRPDELIRYADALARARKETERAAVPERVRREKQLTTYVDGRIRERGTVGKHAADKALALLIGEVTYARRGDSAQRMARTRLAKRRGLSKPTKPKVPKIRALKGSRTSQRRSIVTSVGSSGDLEWIAAYGHRRKRDDD